MTDAVPFGTRQSAPGDDHFRDVQMLAGHAALGTTQRYIEADVDAQRKVVDLLNPEQTPLLP